MHNRRDFKKYLINPQAQIRYGTMFLSLSLVFHILVTMAGIRMYMAWFTRSDATSGTTLAVVFALILAIYAAFYVFAFIFGILISHKIYGPLVNIQRELERYISGDYSQRIQLRKGDDQRIVELSNQINRLIDTLKGS